MSVDSIRLDELVNGVAKMIRRLVPEEIELRIDIPDEVGRISADGHQVERVLLNLAANARDAMPMGGVLTIRVSNTRIDPEYVREHPKLRVGDYVLLGVSDTGAGISAQTREHMFEPFFSTKGADGTGLGLAAVYAVVARSAGHLSVYSELNVGTTVKLYFPRSELQVAPAVPAFAAVPAPGQGERILVAEDDPSVRRVLHRALAQAGYRVVEAETGEDALVAWAAATEVDMLVTDLVMPDMRGTDLAVRCRRDKPQLPVLYLSGYIGDVVGGCAMFTERAAFMHKPFTVDGILSQVRALLDDESREPDGGAADGPSLASDSTNPRDDGKRPA